VVGTITLGSLSGICLPLVELEQQLIKKSLRWPTTYLDKTFPDAFKRISHHGMQTREANAG